MCGFVNFSDFSGVVSKFSKRLVLVASENGYQKLVWLGILQLNSCEKISEKRVKIFEGKTGKCFGQIWGVPCCGVLWTSTVCVDSRSFH